MRSRVASSRATAWVNGCPDGVVKTTVAPSTSPSPRSSSSASPHGSGFITMPAPPPYGVSSTERCRSCVQSRRSCTAISTSPDARALPVRETSSVENQSGKIVTTSIFTSRSLLVVREGCDEPGTVGHDDPAPREIDLRDQGSHEGDERLAAVRGPDLQQVLRPVEDGADVAQ